MLGREPRVLLFAAAALDQVGQLLLIAALTASSSFLAIPSIEEISNHQIDWILFYSFVYPALGWLFGTYSILRWQRLSNRVLIFRVGLTVLVTLIVVAIVTLLFNIENSSWLLRPRPLILWLVFIFSWSSFVRILLRQGVESSSYKLFLIASDSEAKDIQRAWLRLPQRQQLIVLDLNADQLPEWLMRSNEFCYLALGSSWRLNHKARLIDQLNSLDPRYVQVISAAGLFERLQERIPPALLNDGWLTYDEMPWASPLAVQTQIKRTADVILALFLLLVTAPILLLSMFVIRLDDPGPSLYLQQRTGWMGSTFTVFKLRTMRVQPVNAAASWTSQDDKRITRFGQILRRTRIDELPQLINVLRGDMSLIGPRPERPVMEEILKKIFRFIGCDIG